MIRFYLSLGKCIPITHIDVYHVYAQLTSIVDKTPYKMQLTSTLTVDETPDRPKHDTTVDFHCGYNNLNIM